MASVAEPPGSLNDPRTAEAGGGTPRRPVYLLDYVQWGGGETSLLNFLLALRRLRPACAPLVLAPAEGPVVARLRELDFATRVSPWPLRLRRGPLPWYNPAAARRIEHHARQWGADLIHANNFFALLYAGRAARRLALPLVWTCHGWFDIDRPAKRWVGRRLATHVLCPSEGVRAEAARWLPAGRTTTDYLGLLPVDATTWPGAPWTRAAIRAEFGFGGAGPLLGVVGRFQPIKGHQYLVEALPRLVARFPGLHVWLIGDAQPGVPEEAAHKQAVAARLRALGLERQVNWLGFRPDARRLLRALDLLVVPSEAESFSMAAAEGLEAGIPVVGPDGWGPRELIDAPRCGLRFRPKDAADLALRITQVLAREGEGAGFDPAAGPARFSELFTDAAHVRRTLATYARLLNPC